MIDHESWHLPHMQNQPNDSGLIQAEGFGVVSDGFGEMACTAGDEPKQKTGLLHWLLRWLSRPICNL